MQIKSVSKATLGSSTMKISNTWMGVVILGLVLTASPAKSQEFWYVPHIDEAKTPVESELQSGDLAMPGFGLASTKSTIIKRLEYALDHKWLSSSQDQQLCNELKSITDKEQSFRDSDGKLNYSARAEIAKQLTDFNDKFEELVLVREQANPGIPGLQARQAMMLQRVSQAVNAGKMSDKRAGSLRYEIRSIAAEVPEKDITDEQTRKIAGELNRINGELDKDTHNSAVAAKPNPVH